MVRPRPCRQALRGDIKKLENLNGHYIREADDARLAALVAPRLGADAAGLDLLIRAMPELKARAHDLEQLAEGAAFLFDQRPLTMDEKATALLTEEARSHLALVHKFAVRRRNWSHDATDAAVRILRKPRDLAMQTRPPLRARFGRTPRGICDVFGLLAATKPRQDRGSMQSPMHY